MELEQLRQQLRRLIDRFGRNNFPDELLIQIKDKYLDWDFEEFEFAVSMIRASNQSPKLDDFERFLPKPNPLITPEQITSSDQELRAKAKYTENLLIDKNSPENKKKIEEISRFASDLMKYLH